MDAIARIPKHSGCRRARLRDLHSSPDAQIVEVRNAMQRTAQRRARVRHALVAAREIRRKWRTLLDAEREREGGTESQRHKLPPIDVAQIALLGARREI